MSLTWTVFEHPIPTHSYSAGVDVASGYGDSKTAIQVLDNETGHQVASVISDDPIDFSAHWSCHICRYYNIALLVIEISGVGIIFFDYCEYEGYPNLYYHVYTDRKIPEAYRRKGLTVTTTNKGKLSWDLNADLANKCVVLYTGDQEDQDQYWAMAFANYGRRRSKPMRFIQGFPL